VSILPNDVDIVCVRRYFKVIDEDVTNSQGLICFYVTVSHWDSNAGEQRWFGDMETIYMSTLFCLMDSTKYSTQHD